MHWIGYARSGTEFDTAEELASYCKAAIVPRRVDVISRGKSRKPKLEDAPFLGNYIVIEASEDQYYKITIAKGCGALKTLNPTMMGVPPYHSASLVSWCEQIESEAKRIIQAHKRGEELSLFKAGDSVQITDGPFAEWLEGQRVTFERMVHAAGDPFPSARVSADLMGRKVSMDVDPLMVKRTGE